MLSRELVELVCLGRGKLQMNKDCNIMTTPNNTSAYFCWHGEVSG